MVIVPDPGHIQKGNNGMRLPTILLLATIIFPGSSLAAGGMVEALQMPAWIERGGERQALKPGAELRSGDIVRTGEKSRALLRLEEGSIVKLGENASLNLNTISPPKQKNGIFAALIKVTRGAFRFTTTELGKTRKRRVDVNIGSVTIGIRGTDIWGRSRPDEDLFALLEGKVSVKRAGEAEFTMSDPLHYILAPNGEPTSAVTPIESAQLGAWADETEPQAGSGLITTDGRWAVNMMSLQDPSSAERLQQRLHEAGYASQITPVQINEQNWLRVRIEGFASREDADSFASHINNQFGIQQPWVARF